MLNVEVHSVSNIQHLKSPSSVRRQSSDTRVRGDAFESILSRFNDSLNGVLKSDVEGWNAMLNVEC